MDNDLIFFRKRYKPYNKNYPNKHTVVINMNIVRVLGYPPHPPPFSHSNLTVIEQTIYNDVIITLKFLKMVNLFVSECNHATDCYTVYYT